MATKDWAYRRKAGDGRRDLVQDTVHFLSPPLPLPRALSLSSTVWMEEQWVLSGWQVLQRLVTLLLQVTVVVLLGRQRHAVQWVMSVQPLLLFQCQALQLG